MGNRNLGLVTLGSLGVFDSDKTDLNNGTDLNIHMLLKKNKKNINIYVMNDNGNTSQQKVTEYGFYFESFSNAIAKQNQTINFTHDLVRKYRRDKYD